MLENVIGLFPRSNCASVVILRSRLGCLNIIAVSLPLIPYQLPILNDWFSTGLVGWRVVQVADCIIPPLDGCQGEREVPLFSPDDGDSETRVVSFPFGFKFIYWPVPLSSPSSPPLTSQRDRRLHRFWASKLLGHYKQESQPANQPPHRREPRYSTMCTWPC